MENTEIVLNFPVHKLNSEITEKISKIRSSQIPEQIQKGLQNEIMWVDLLGKITTVAELDSLNRVKLSSAYCQFLWIICDIAIKTYDANVLELELAKETEEIKDALIKMVKLSQKRTKEIDVLNEIIDHQAVFEKAFSEFGLAEQLITTKFTKEDVCRFNCLDMTSDYGSKTNSVYCYGIIFILLHELAHFRFGHICPTKEDEKDAYSLAFWDIYYDVLDTDKITATLGVISALFSLLFFSKDLNGDEQHPDEDKRVFEIFDIVRDDCANYAGLIVQFFKLWAFYWNIKDFPSMSETYEQTLDDIKNWLEKKKK